MAAAAKGQSRDPHIPVLLDAILEACGPISGHWLDGTFGAGGRIRAGWRNDERAHHYRTRSTHHL